MNPINFLVETYIALVMSNNDTTSLREFYQLCHQMNIDPAVVVKKASPIIVRKVSQKFK